MSGRSWLLLDRDNTILDDPGYLSDPDQVVFLPGALEGLKRFHEAGWPLVVLTNQSGIGRGYFGVEELKAVHDRFQELLAERGVKLSGIFYCPHSPEEGCNCRKPAPGLAEQASRELGLELSEAIMVGDKESDLLLGREVECRQVIQIVAKSKAIDGLADHHFFSLKELADHLGLPG